MKLVGIATDSQSGIMPMEAVSMGVTVLPMPFYFGETCYFEGVSITRDEFFTRLKEGEKVSTSQPSPESVMDLWREALKEYEKIVYIPMSSGLSGSYNTAKMLSEDDEFAGRVLVADAGRVATPLRRAIMDAVELRNEGYSAEEIKETIEEYSDKMSIYIAVETLEYLKRGGRVSPATAAIGTLLNIKPVLRLGVGVLDTYRKCRGMKKAKEEMLEAMKRDIEVTYKEYYENGEIFLLAASSADGTTTEEWINEIKTFFPGMEVMCDNLTLGISCHTGEGALGIGCSVKPRRKAKG